MRRIPSFVLVRAFEAAARLESFTRAAEELHLTPSAISHQVRQLEAFLELSLFDRRQNRLHLTADGKRFFARMVEVLNALEAACNELGLHEDGQRSLAVHCSPSFAVKWLGPRLPRFMAAHPEIAVKLSSSSGPFDLLARPEVDVAITFGPGVARAGVQIHGLGRERVVPLCAPALMRSLGKTGLALIEAAPLIDSQISAFRWRDWFERNGLAFERSNHLSFDRAILVIAAAVDAMGIALESTRMAEREIARGELVAIEDARFPPFEQEAHFFVQRANELHKKPGKAFKAWLFEQLGPGPAPDAPLSR